MTFSFSGKRVLVTGAASGIGRAVALRLAQEGAELYLTDVNAEGLDRTAASKYGLHGVSEVLSFDLARHHIGVSLVVPGAVDTPLVQTVQIAGVDRDDPAVQKWVRRFSGHAVTPEKAAEKILDGVGKNRFLIYTSQDIRALYAFKRFAPRPYSEVMKRVNVLFTRALRPKVKTPLELPQG